MLRSDSPEHDIENCNDGRRERNDNQEDEVGWSENDTGIMVVVGIIMDTQFVFP